MRFLRRLIGEIIDDRVLDLGAMLAYYAVLSLFPMLLFVVSLALLVLPSGILAQGVHTAAEALPSEVRPILIQRADALIHATSSKFAITGAVLALWGASRGAASLGEALDTLWRRPERRSWLHRQLVAIAVTLVIAVLMIAALALLVVGPMIGDWLSLGRAFDVTWAIARWVGAGVLVLLLWAIVYRFLPDSDRPFRMFTPGACAGVAMWLVMSWGFGVYLAHARSYEATYGTLGGAIVFLTWLWLSNVAMLVGAEIDDVLRGGAPVRAITRKCWQQDALPCTMPAMKTSLACLFLVAGCPNVATDPGQGPGELPPIDGPTVEFDPANAIIPFPNNLILNPMTGKVTLPKQCNEGPATTALRTGVIDKLDGFGTFEATTQATFTDAPDLTSLLASTTTFATNNVVLFKRASGTTAIDPTTATAIPIAIELVQLPRFSTDCSMVTMVQTAVIVPQTPLDESSTYTAAILQGAKTASGDDFIPSFTWALTRQPVDPVTIDANGNVIVNNTPLDPSPGGDANNNGIPDIQELVGIDTLWKAHAAAMTFLAGAGHNNDSVLLAWEFTTQTVTGPLDPAVAGSPAAALDATTPIPNPLSILSGPIAQCAAVGLPAPCTAEDFIDKSLPGACTKSGGYLPCNAVGDIEVSVGAAGGGLASASYQQLTPNPGGTQLNSVPGQWSDPLHPTKVSTAKLDTLIFVPAAAAPATGYPTVVFGHGLGSSKESLAAIAPTLASQGIASVAIDFVDSGSRAVLITTDASLACNGKLSPTANNQCFAPVLSADLGTTRDNIRQTVLDLHQLALATAACGTTKCGALKVDASRINYTGISLGGIIGTTTASTSDFKAAVLDVPGVGLVDILENTLTPQISCSLVDGLIAAGIIMGTPSDITYDAAGNATVTTGTCLIQSGQPGDWRTQPGYQQFAGVARWVLDPADGANFVGKFLTQKRFLIEEVVLDQVVPNIATDDEGALVGLTPGMADISAALPPPASAAIVPATNIWVRYADLGQASGFPGNAFEHASLLRPSSKTSFNGNQFAQPAAGVLGTLRLQVDALTFLLLNQ